MVHSSTFWLLSCLLVTITLANQTPPEPDNACFTSNNALPDENHKACCPTETADGKPQNGAGYAGGVQFTYRCGYYPEPSGKLATTTAISMQDCAALCAKDDSCMAGAWKHTEHACYLTSEMAVTGQDSHWVLLEKKTRPECPELEAVLERCKQSKTLCEKTNSQLQVDKNTVLKNYTTCAVEKERLSQENTSLAEQKQQCDRGLVKCEAGKSSCATDLERNKAELKSSQDKLIDAYEEIKQLRENTDTVAPYFVPGRQNDGQEVIIGGKRWGINYANMSDNSWDLGAPTVDSYVECMKLCASKQTCVRTVWVNDRVGAGTCWMRSVSRQDVTVIQLGHLLTLLGLLSCLGI